MNDITALRIALLERFECLLAHVERFCSQLRTDRLPLWVSRTEDEITAGREMRDKAAQLFQSLWYEDGQDGRETLTCPGLIGASRNTLAAAHTLNDTKDAFKETVLRLKRLRKAEADSVLLELHKRNQEVALAMRRMGVSRLNLKQAYRHVPLLDERPAKVGFTWSKQGRTIQRLSVPEARRLLERRSETPQIRQELDRLSRLPNDEPLARARPVCPHLRANVVFEGHAERERRLIQTPLPLLIPLQAGESLPDFVPVPPEPSGIQRLRRSDVRLEDEPLLPLLQVFRYRYSYRG